MFQNYRELIILANLAVKYNPKPFLCSLSLSFSMRISESLLHFNSYEVTVEHSLKLGIQQSRCPHPRSLTTRFPLPTPWPTCAGSGQLPQRQSQILRRRAKTFLKIGRMLRRVLNIQIYVEESRSARGFLNKLNAAMKETWRTSWISQWRSASASGL